MPEKVTLLMGYKWGADEFLDLQELIYAFI